MLSSVFFPCHNLDSEVTTNPFKSEVGTKYPCIDHQLKAAVVGQRVHVVTPS